MLEMIEKMVENENDEKSALEAIDKG